MYSRDNFRLVKEEIESRRVRAESEATLRSEELGRKYPEIAKIDKELTGTGLLLFRTACEGGDIAPIRKRNEALMKRREELLESVGLPKDYTRPHYTCPVCQDTGYSGHNLCACFKELLTLKNIESSGMGSLIEKQSFDNFDPSWYSDSEDGHRRMKLNLHTAKEYAESFGTHRDNLLLIGTTGTGKTHISTAIARVVIGKGFDVLYDSAQNIISAFEQDRFRSGYSKDIPVSEKYMECDLLILDDLGTEFSNQFTVSCLYNLINTRLNRGLCTIISTNLSAEELAGKYEGRIYSRIVGSDYKVMFFTGKDHRVFNG